MQGLGVEPAAALQRLAGYGNMTRLGVAERKDVERFGQGVTAAVERLEDVEVNRLSGRAFEPEQGPRLGLEPAAPAEDGGRRRPANVRMTVTTH